MFELFLTLGTHWKTLWLKQNLLIIIKFFYCPIFFNNFIHKDCPKIGKMFSIYCTQNCLWVTILSRTALLAGQGYIVKQNYHFPKSAINRVTSKTLWPMSNFPFCHNVFKHSINILSFPNQEASHKSQVVISEQSRFSLTSLSCFDSFNKLM